jgi:hypothetical protein
VKRFSKIISTAFSRTARTPPRRALAATSLRAPCGWYPGRYGRCRANGT